MRSAEVTFHRIALLVRSWTFYLPAILLIPSLLTAQPLPKYASNLTVRDGLSNNWIRSGGNILRDTMGFLWVGTHNGLNRYDGSTFKTYRYNPYDSTSLRDNNIWTLYMDRLHRLWIAHNAGVDRYDPLKDAFVHYSFLKEEDSKLNRLFPSAILEDSHGNFLVGTMKGIYQLDRSGKFVRTELAVSGLVNSIIEDDEGQLWVGSYGGQPCVSVFKWQEGTGWVPHRQFHKKPGPGKGVQGNNVIKIFEDSSGTVWIATFSGLDRYNRKSNSFTPFLRDQKVSDIEEDAKGQLWVATEDSGLYILDRAGKKFTSFPDDPTLPSNFPANATEIYFSAPHEMWVGTFSSGLYYFNGYFPTFKVYNNEPDLFVEITATPRIKTIGSYFFEPPESPVWVASRNSLYRFDEKNFTFSQLKDIPIRSDIVGIKERPDGSVWIQARNGLYLFDPRKETVTPYLQDRKFQHFIEDRNGNIWTDDGQGRSVYCLRRDSGRAASLPLTTQIESYPVCRHNSDGGAAGSHITFIREDSHENIWVGTKHGLYRYESTTGEIRPFDFEGDFSGTSGKAHFMEAFEDSRQRWWTYTGEAVYRYLPEEDRFTRYAGDAGSRKGLSSHSKIFFYEDSRGTIWVATFGGGLNRYDEKADAFTSFIHNQKDSGSISNDDILDLHEDRKKRLWIATKGGLNCWDPQLKSFTKWVESDGLISNSIGSILEDKDGQLWLGTAGGLSRFDPESTTFSNYTYRNGLPDNYLFQSIHFISQSGTVFFRPWGWPGKEFFAFHPQDLKNDPFRPKLAFTGFRLFNKPLAIRGTAGDTLNWPSPLKQHISYTRKIDLEHWQNDLSIEFAALDFSFRKKISFYTSWKGTIKPGSKRRPESTEPPTPI